MSNLPVIDDAYIRRVFDSLGNMQVDLDGDPLVFGPKRLNSKVALCREHLSKCQTIYLNLSDHLHQLSRANRAAKLDFDIKAQDLLANDPEVKSQRAIRDREAVVSSKLRVERETNHLIETAITDLESVIMVVKAKREDLKDIQGRIRDQVKLCQEEIGLGGRWGSSPPPGVRVDLDSRPRVDPRALDDFNDVLEGLEGESSITDLSKFVRDELVSRGEPAPEPEVPSVVVEEELDLDSLLETTVQGNPPPAAKVDEEPAFELPAVTSDRAPSQSSTSSHDEVEDFFSAFETTPAPAPATSANKPVAAPPVAELDIDDLLSEFIS